MVRDSTESKMFSPKNHNKSMSAATVAQLLANKFYEMGCYTAIRGPLELQLGPATAATDGQDVAVETQAFAGLAVQSVGYEVGPEQPRVHVYVTKSSRKGEKELPEELAGVEVVINRMGRISISPAASGIGHVYVRGTRVACGSSCAPSGEDYSGTFGALVRRTGDTALYGLSNNHVFSACNHVPVGMPILSPSNMDTRPTTRAPSAIARHSHIVELRSGVPPLVAPCNADLALARIVDESVVSSWQGETDGFDTPTSIQAPLSGMRVKKVGRTSGLTVGTVEALINTPTSIPYRSRFFNATVWFQDVWTINGGSDMFACGGDSGSLVVTEDGMAAVGIVFAANPAGTYGWMIPMVHAQTLFGGLTLVSQHGL